MLQQITYFGSWAKVKFNKKLGQRGAEMVEYAIVLACIVIVAFAYYHLNAWANERHNNGEFSGTTTKSALNLLFDKMFNAMPK